MASIPPSAPPPKEENGISSLPPELGRLASLASLGLINNMLTSLPSEMGSLDLRSLMLGNNLLNALPKSFGRLSALTRLDLSVNRFTTVPILEDSPQALPNLMFMNVEGNNITAWPNGWTVQKNVSIAALPFNTTARAVGDSGAGLYDTYAAQRTADKNLMLMLMGSNPVVRSHMGGRGDGGARLLEMKRGELPTMLVSSRPECAPGCISTPWKAVKQKDNRGDYFCRVECNQSACEFDGGDCLRV